MSSCGFLMAALSASDYQKYGSFTLAIVQNVDLNAQWLLPPLGRAELRREPDTSGCRRGAGPPATARSLPGAP